MKTFVLLFFFSAMPLLWTGCVNPASPDFTSRDDLDVYLDAWSWLNIYYLFQDELPKDPFAFTDPSALYNSVSDPWTVYFPPEQAAGFMSNFSTGNEGGLGIFYQVRNNKFCIISVIPGSPAFHSLFKGDTLTAVGNKPVDSTTTRDTLASWLHDSAGSSVTLWVLRPGVGTVSALITRGPFIAPTVIADTLDANVAYIALFEFMDNTTVSGGTSAELTPILAQTASFPVRILDLRGNPGGFVQQCLDVSGAFLKSGDTIVRAKIRDPGRTFDTVFLAAGSASEANKKIIILVDDSTASAAEMLTAGIQHNDSSAYIMGVHTYGKARGQVVIPATLRGAVKITVMAMTTADGVDYNHTGLMPDTVMSNSDKTRWLEIAHNRALDWLGVPHKTTAAAIQEVSDRISDIELNRKLLGTKRSEKFSWIKRPGK